MGGLRHGNVFTTGNFVFILAETGESLKLDSRIRFSEFNVAGEKLYDRLETLCVCNVLHTEDVFISDNN